ncbi:MAG: (d)CMP kinase [Candidatus Enterosoma sp.]|nr:(d)CMP kinase [Bacilli bacterium]MDD7572263.1 (d)CMP kinase [bacterium]MDY2571941.1 (d)CMP kinase [Candidatus Enterosoma sp.]MCI6524841.1 (d)CMP kinase [Bacilli bacterium]MCI6609134.1 (d)CMP kinase [Bacilli bacterium]
MKTYSIAIDGPAASGKSTAAKGVAKALDFLYLDTGAMYRAITLYMIEKGLDTRSEEDAKSILDEVTMREDKNGHIFLNERDVTERVREEDVTKLVSYACAHKAVRERLVALQREMAKGESVVMDGRDIGTVVLPDATLKVYQVASVESRAKRRYLEELSKGKEASLDEIQKDIERRDYIDSHREHSPLRKAEDAILLDTSDLTIQEEIDAILSLFREKAGELK